MFIEYLLNKAARAIELNLSINTLFTATQTAFEQIIKLTKSPQTCRSV